MGFGRGTVTLRFPDGRSDSEFSSNGMGDGGLYRLSRSV